MLKFFKDIFYTNEESYDEIQPHYTDEKKVKLATCALFLEIANSDDEMTTEEKEKIIDIMKTMYDLSEEEVKELIHLSKEQVQKSVSLYEFTDVINSHFNSSQKYEVVKNLWRIILADEKIDKYEHFFIRRINSNLHLEHSDMIAAKMEVKKEMGID